MQRRIFLAGLAGIGALFQPNAAVPFGQTALIPPKTGKIPVAFVMGPQSTMIDFAGPWEVFQDVHVMARGTTMDEMHPFELFTVSDTTQPLLATGGMKIVPDFDFAAAPRPKIIVIPAQGNHSRAKIEWIKEMSKSTDVTMSVCTGAFLLARTGLLDGKVATTHHDFYDRFATSFPKVRLQRSRRYVENGNLCSAGGLTSGIDLAIHVVERYFGRAVATTTAEYMEYQGRGWLDNVNKSDG